jgi:hypothetical protein
MARHEWTENLVHCTIKTFFSFLLLQETVGSGELRHVSEYLIPQGEQYHSCILRSWRPAFLHPKGQIQICHRADEQNALKIVSPPSIKVKTKPVHLRKPANPWPIRKTHLTQS